MGKNRGEPVTVVPVVAELRSADEPHASRATSVVGAIKGLFRAAAKAITRESEDEPRPKPVKRRGETEGEFKRLVRLISRRFDVRQQFRRRAAILSRYITIPVEARATAYLADTL